MSNIAEMLIKAESISTYIEVLTNPKMVSKIQKHIQECEAYYATDKEKLRNYLYALDYLRKSFELETKGKALSSMAAKHKGLVQDTLRALFPNHAGTFKDGNAIYLMLNEMLSKIEDDKETIKTEEGEPNAQPN